MTKLQQKIKWARIKKRAYILYNSRARMWLRAVWLLNGKKWN